MEEINKGGRPKGLAKTGGRQKGSKNKTKFTVDEINDMKLKYIKENFPKFLKILDKLPDEKALNIFMKMVETSVPKVEIEPEKTANTAPKLVQVFITAATPREALEAANSIHLPVQAPQLEEEFLQDNLNEDDEEEL